jgi:transcriptional regulator with PAS, ATPase and Fis domain
MRTIADLNSLLDAQPANRQRQIVAQSPVMHNLIAEAKRYAHSPATVLITGESGCGKELIARLIHEHSPRATKPYVAVNCAALPENLVESELFGHERGAFTGASEGRTGRFEWADGGTLLLDEISEIPSGMQAKLLRVLEEGEFQRVGANRSYRVNVRVVATSNRSLEEEIAAGNFRADLFYRLNILQLRLPPLRERRDDIPALVIHFLDRFRHEASVPITGVEMETLEILNAYDWPGNIRQLRNVIHRACLVNTSGVLQPSNLPPLEPTDATLPGTLTEMRLEDIERHAILANLRKFNGNKTAAAQQLGVTSRTLSNKMKRYRELGYV